MGLWLIEAEVESESRGAWSLVQLINRTEHTGARFLWKVVVLSNTRGLGWHVQGAVATQQAHEHTSNIRTCDHVPVAATRAAAASSSDDAAIGAVSRRPGGGKTPKSPS